MHQAFKVHSMIDAITWSSLHNIESKTLRVVDRLHERNAIRSTALLNIQGLYHGPRSGTDQQLESDVGFETRSVEAE
jgi:hypothetical protein